MTEQAINSELMRYINKLNRSQKKSVLNLLKTVFIKEKNVDWWEKLSEEQEEDIALAEREYEEGKFISNEQVMKMMEKWF